MTYQDLDESEVLGAPEELYRFTRGTSVWRWTTSDAPIVYNAEAYAVAPFERETIEQGGETSRVGSLALKMPLSHQFAREFLESNALLNQPVFCTVYARHRDDTEFWTVIIGQVTEIRAEEAGVLTVVIRRADGRLSRKIPRMVMGKNCQHVFGDARCGFSVSGAAFTSTISAIDITDNRIVTITGLSTEEDGQARRFVGGVLKQSGVVMGYINGRGSGNVVFLLEGNSLLETGQSVTLEPACGHSIEDCQAYDNVTHYGGWHLIKSIRMPFEGEGFAPTD